MERVEQIQPPTLNGRGVRLVPLKRDHWELLFQWESDPASLYLWTMRKDVPSETEFYDTLVSRLRGYYHTVFLIQNTQDEPAGFTYSYDANLVDGYVFTTTFLQPGHRERGLGAKAGLLFYDYLFAYFPIRKLYADVFEYNKASLSLLKNAGFEVEGTFKHHRFFGGQYWTLYRLALYRETFYSKKAKLCK